MEQKILWDLYCFQCSLKFEQKSTYDMHLSLIHNQAKKKNTFCIKSEPEEVEISNHSTIQSKHKEEQELIKKNALPNEKKRSFKCEFCEKCFSGKTSVNKHIASVHEGKKSFKCKACDHSFSEKCNLKTHVTAVHEGKKLYHCERCDYSFS